MMDKEEEDRDKGSEDGCDVDADVVDVDEG